jgi:hypothetical protein
VDESQAIILRNPYQSSAQVYGDPGEFGVVIADNVEEALVAAASIIDVVDGKEAQQNKKRRQSWQELAWQYYDEIGEIWFAMNFIANALRRIRIFIAVQPDPTQPPIPVDFNNPPDAAAAAAIAALDRLRADDGSHGELIHDMTMQLSIPGEGYLLGEWDDETAREKFFIASIAEWRPQSQDPTSAWRLFDGPTDTTGRELHPDPSGGVFFARMWRQHPKWRLIADSAMRAVITQCNTLQILERGVRAAGRSRLSAGVLFVPAEATLKPMDGQEQSFNGNGAKVDPFLNAMMTALITPIQEEGSASAVVPALIKMKAELIEKVRLLTFAQDFNPQAQLLREEALRRIAAGMDIPAEVVLNKGELNHWTAWQVDDATFNAHLFPLLQLQCSNLTEGFLQPTQRAEGFGNTEYMVWFDPSALIAHPNRSGDADAAWDRGVISDPAYRNYKGYTEEDAQTEEERAQWIETKQLLGRGNEMTSSEGPNSGKLPPLQPQGSAELEAAAVPAFDGRALGLRLAAIDRGVLTKLQASCQSVAFRAVKHGQELQAAATTETTGAAVATLAATYDRQVRLAQRQAADAISEYLADGEVAALFAAQDVARREGWNELVGALTAVIDSEIHEPTIDAVPEFGEVSNLLVPPGLVRQVLASVGGGGKHGGLATGPQVMDRLAAAGIEPTGYEWQYGEGSRGTPFPAHEGLDGTQFTDWEDATLAVQGGDEWLGVDYYEPGDHRWCQCLAAPVLAQTQAQEAA